MSELCAARDSLSEGIARQLLAEIYLDTSRIDEAEREYGEALGNLATSCNSLGRPAEAELLHLQALALHRDLKNRRFEGLQLCDYACALVTLGRRGEAQAAWREGAAILRELRDAQAVELKRAGVLDACARAGVEAIDVEVG